LSKKQRRWLLRVRKKLKIKIKLSHFDFKLQFLILNSRHSSENTVKIKLCIKKKNTKNHILKEKKQTKGMGCPNPTVMAVVGGSTVIREDGS
jgi:hypothetical protein